MEPNTFSFYPAITFTTWTTGSFSISTSMRVPDLTIAAAERSIEAARNFGVLDTDVNHRVIGFAEKPTQPRPMSGRPGHARISMGIYVFKTDVLIDVLA